MLNNCYIKHTKRLAVHYITQPDKHQPLPTLFANRSNTVNKVSTNR